MSNWITRAALMMLFCLGLSGCAPGIISTYLKNIPAQPDETKLLKSAGYVVHSTTPGKFNSGEEVTSWVHALADFTNQGNIFLFENGKPTSMIHSYEEFSKNHPIVTIELKANSEVPSPIPIFSIFTLGIIPFYDADPYTATFTLSMHGEKPEPDLHWNYEYSRHTYLWILLFPFANYGAALLSGEGSFDNHPPGWKIEEKRRLLLRFLQDAKPFLQAYTKSD